MKVVLKEDVFKLGSLGDEVDVKSGFARNFLIPQGKALPLTRENVKQINHQRSLLAKTRADAIEQAKNIAQQLGEAELLFTMKSGDTGKLFGSVTQKHIYDALVEKGINLDRKQLNLSNPIKSLGSHVLSVRLHTEVNVDIVVKVAAEADENKDESVEGEIQVETQDAVVDKETIVAETAD